MIPCFQLQKPFSAASTNIFLSRWSWGSRIPQASDLVPSIIAKFCERGRLLHLSTNACSECREYPLFGACGQTP